MNGDTSNDGGAVLQWLTIHLWEPLAVLLDLFPWWLWTILLYIAWWGFCITWTDWRTDREIEAANRAEWLRRGGTEEEWKRLRKDAQGWRDDG